MGLYLINMKTLNTLKLFTTDAMKKGPEFAIIGGERSKRKESDFELLEILEK